MSAEHENAVVTKSNEYAPPQQVHYKGAGNDQPLLDDPQQDFNPVETFAHCGAAIRYYSRVRTMWFALMVGTLACGHARARPVPQEPSPPKEPLQSPGVPADETHAPKPVDAQTMPPISRVFDNVVFSILLPANTEVSQGWTGYFLADGKKIPNTDFKIEKVVGRGAKGSIAADKLPAPNKLPSSDVRLFSPRVEH